MATRQWFLDLGNLHDLIEVIAAENVGYAAACVDNDKLLACMLDEFFYGFSLSAPFKAHFENMRFPSDCLDSFHKHLTQQLERTLQATVGLFYPCRTYSYTIDNDRLHITEETVTLQRRRQA